MQFKFDAPLARKIFAKNIVENQISMNKNAMEK